MGILEFIVYLVIRIGISVKMLLRDVKSIGRPQTAVAPFAAVKTGRLVTSIKAAEIEMGMNAADRFSAEPSAATLGESVYRLLRADILWGCLPPGAPLRSAELCAHYKVGISPLREALSRLLGEQLVTSVEQRGFRVGPIDEADIRDTLETRVLIEREAIRKSIRLGDLDWETKIVASQHAFAHTPVPTGPGSQCELWAARHRAFHLALLSACGSSLQYNFAGKLIDRALRQTIIIVLGCLSGELVLERDRNGEHDDIVKAALARDAHAACDALESHHRLSAKYVLSSLKNWKAAEP